MPSSLMLMSMFTLLHPMMCICSNFLNLGAVIMVINKIFNVRTAHVLHLDVPAICHPRPGEAVGSLSSRC